MLGILALLVCVMQTVSANYQSDIDYSGPALNWTPDGDETIDASLCLGGCSVNGRCMELAVTGKANAEFACSAANITKYVGIGVGVGLVLCFISAFLYFIVCNKKQDVAEETQGFSRL